MSTEANEETLFSEDLQRQWLSWLSRKWAQINRSVLHGALKSPGFRIGWRADRLGAWSHTGRILEIQGAHLAEDTSAEVEYTLRHEMAHQIVSEIFKAPEAKPHGALFDKACNMLGILGGPLAEKVKDEEAERIIRKARKLLALASSSNTHEAASAMARAQELLGTYNLDIESCGSPPSFAFRWLGGPQGRVPLERKLIAEIIQEFFFVQCIWIRTTLVTGAKKATLLEAFGQNHNLEIASYIHDSLMSHVDILWKAHKKSKQAINRRDRGAFRVGVVMGFQEYLKSLLSQREEQALIWSGDPALQEFISARHPRLVRSSGGRYHPGSALEEGRRQGKELRIHPGMTQAKKSSRAPLKLKR